MSTQPNDLPFLVKRIQDELMGGTVVGGVIDPEEESFGIKFSFGDGVERVAWIDRDAEGNGPGWVSIERIIDDE